MNEHLAADQNIALLPCPFCGGTAQFQSIPNEDGDPQAGGEYVECSQCQSCTNLVFPLMDGVKRQLAERWNRRPTGDAMLELRAQGWRWQEYAEHLEHCVECGMTGPDSCHEGGMLRAAALGESVDE
jgi:Lar family restriction alleviation protein